MQGNLYTVIVITHASLFSGIGGFDLAAEWMGWENVFHCENDAFCQKILTRHFPHSQSYGDIRTVNGKEWNGKIDIITGGFPCQPFSNAGKRRGSDDDRFLWPEMLRVICEIAPSWVVAENVPGILTIENGMVLKQVYTDLEAAGYKVYDPMQIPACAVNAWHRRDRIWIVADRKEKRTLREPRKICGKDGRQNDERFSDFDEPISRHDSDHREERREGLNFQEIPKFRGLQRGEDERVYANIEGRPDLSTPVLCRSYDGIPHGMDRVGACGNAIVPQIAYQIFQSLPLCNI